MGGAGIDYSIPYPIPKILKKIPNTRICVNGDMGGAGIDYTILYRSLKFLKKFSISYPIPDKFLKIPYPFKEGTGWIGAGRPRWPS